MEVTLSVPRRNRVQVRAERGGSIVLFEDFTPTNARDRQAVADKLGISVDVLTQHVVGMTSRESQVKFTVEDPKPNEFTILRRDIEGTSGDTFSDVSITTALKNALAHSSGNLLAWQDSEELAVLDIDYHGRPVSPLRDRCIALLQPRPHFQWLSRSGGVHAVYTRTHNFSATELAAVAGLGWMTLEPTATFDIVKQVRVPLGTIHEYTPTEEMPGLSAWLRKEISEDAIEQMLSDKGYEFGGKYTHDLCPVSPGPSHGEPVFVGEEGVYCHKCHAAGVRMGSRKPGWFPWPALLHGGVAGVVFSMAQRFTHWEHARIILHDLFPGVGEIVLEKAFRVCLKRLHSKDDPRIEKVFFSGNDIIRVAERWATRDANGFHDKKLDPLLASLPACQNDEGKPVGELVSRFQQRVDLREYGYPDVTPVRGLKIAGQHLAINDPDSYNVIVPAPLLRKPSCERFRPRYVKKSERMDVEHAWEVVESVMPGVNRRYVELLIAAKGCSEAQTGLPPMVLVTGPTAAGKTAMVNLAAAICGDVNTECPWERNLERFRQKLQTASSAGSYFTVNEILKDAERMGSTAVQALDVFLNATPASVSHVLYVGPVALGKVPVCVCTEVAIPQRLRDDAQISRRFVYVRLDDSHLEWQRLFADSGLRSPDNFRVWQEGRGANAADAIVSDIIDRFFSEVQPFGDIAKSLGFCQLSESQDFDDPESDLKELYSAWLEHPVTAGDDIREFDPRDEHRLAVAWERVCDDPNGNGAYTSRRVSEIDWRRVLGKSSPITVRVRRNRDKVRLQFTERVR